jgi:chromosome segregation ATPase
MTELNSTSQIFKQSAESFNQSQFPLKLSLAVVDFSNTQQKFSESATSLAATTELIINALIQIENSSQSLINLGEEIKSMNQTSIQVLELHQNNQNFLSEIIPQLHAGANSYEKATSKLDDLDQRVGDKFNNFDQLITAMSQLLENVKTYTTELISTVSTETENSSQSLISLAEEIKAMNQTSIQVLDSHQNNQNLLTKIIPGLQQGANSYEKAVNKLDDLDQRVSDKVNSFDQLITTIGQLLRQTNINKKGFEANVQGLELLIKNLEEYQQKLGDTNTD